MHDLWFRIKEIWGQGPFLKIVVGILVGILFLGIMWISVIAPLFSSSSSFKTPVRSTPEPIQEEKTKSTPISTKTTLSPIRSNEAYGVDNALQLGEKITELLKESGPTNGLVESIEFTKDLEDTKLDETNIFVRQIESLRSMKNIATINVIGLMSESNDRAQTLDNLTTHINQQLSQGKETYTELQSEIQQLKSELSIHQSLQKEASKQSLIGFEQSDPKLLYEAMLLSIEEGNIANELYTKIKMLEKFPSIYDKLAKYLTIKLKFITANRDGLIKGVVVVNIKGSDEDLILTEDEWRKAIAQ